MRSLLGIERKRNTFRYQLGADFCGCLRAQSQNKFAALTLDQERHAAVLCARENAADGNTWTALRTFSSTTKVQRLSCHAARFVLIHAFDTVWFEVRHSRTMSLIVLSDAIACRRRDATRSFGSRTWTGTSASVKWSRVFFGVRVRDELAAVGVVSGVNELEDKRDESRVGSAESSIVNPATC